MVPTTNLNAEILPTSGSIPGRVLGVISGPTVRCVIRRTTTTNVASVLVVAGHNGNTVRSRFSRSFRLRGGLRNGTTGHSLCRDILTYSSVTSVCFGHRGRAGNLTSTVCHTGDFINSRPFTVLCNSSIVSTRCPIAGRLASICRGFNGNIMNIRRIPHRSIPGCYALSMAPLRGGIVRIRSVLRGPSLSRVVSYCSVLNEIIVPPRVFKVVRGAPPMGNRINFATTVGALTGRNELGTISFVNGHFSVNGGLNVLGTGYRVNLHRPRLGSSFGTCLGRLISGL